MGAGASDTIAAIASPAGPGRRGIVRLSGPRTLELVRACWRGAPLAAEAPRGAWTGAFHDGTGEQPALLLWMPGPRSFTREDVAELHLPGSPFLLARALERLLALGARAAQPGEFTRRAFESGRLDLTRAEGVLALVEARSEDERRSAAALLFGGLERRVEGLRDALEALRALCEAGLDFDESDTGHVDPAELDARLAALLERAREAAGWEARRQVASGERRVALRGAPNAGKSTLFNALVEEGRAIVTDLAGTTRDVLAGTWPLAGTRVVLLDTAGTEVGRDTAERRAQALGAGAAAGADLVLHVVDARAEPPAAAAATLVVRSKADLLPPDAPRAGLCVSVHAGVGLDALAAAVARRLGLDEAGAADGGGADRARLERELSARHRHALQAAVRALEDARGALGAGLPLDLVAEELRGATRELDQVCGRTTPEDLLDRVFAAFCLGK